MIENVRCIQETCTRSNELRQYISFIHFAVSESLKRISMQMLFSDSCGGLWLDTLVGSFNQPLEVFFPFAFFPLKHTKQTTTVHTNNISINKMYLFQFSLSFFLFVTFFDRYMSERFENVCAWSSCHWRCSNFILLLQLRKCKYIEATTSETHNYSIYSIRIQWCVYSYKNLLQQIRRL